MELETKGFRIDLNRAQWFKSTRSGPNCDNCVEVAFVEEAIGRHPKVADWLDRNREPLKIAVTAASTRLLKSCAPQAFNSASVPPAAIFVSSPRAIARKPIGADLDAVHRVQGLHHGRMLAVA